MRNDARKLRVLFLCVANSCRSQMAEGFARHFFRGRIEAFSAGMFAAGLSSYAVKVMEEMGIDISRQSSKSLGKFLDEEFDYVITLCSELEEKCPAFPGGARHVHLGFEDPTSWPGSEEERLQHHRDTRDEMKSRLLPLLEKLLTKEGVGLPREGGESA